MSTPNFNITKVMDKYNLPLMVQSNEMLYKYIMEEEFNEDLDIDIFYFEVQNGLDCLELDIEADFDELKDKLTVFSIELISGYYSGIQFKIDMFRDCAGLISNSQVFYGKQRHPAASSYRSVIDVIRRPVSDTSSSE
jgi:hypothetical protein